MYNKIMILGHLTRDIDIKSIGDGMILGNTAIASNKKYKKSSGEVVDESMFIDLKAFGNIANIFSKYTKKGSKVFVEGELKQERWEKDGQKFSKHVVVVNVLKLLDAKTATPGNESTISEDDIPF